MAFALDNDANEGNKPESRAENSAPTWLKIAISVAAVAVVGGLFLIDTEPRQDRGTTTRRSTTSQPTTTAAAAVPRPEARGLISTTTLGPGEVGGETEEPAGAVGAPPAFVVRQLDDNRSLRTGTLYAFSAFGELVAADLSTGEVSVLDEGLPTSPTPHLIGIDGGVVVADERGARFYEASGGKGARPVATSAVDITSVDSLLPFAGLVGLVDRTPAGSRVTVTSASFISDGVILKPFGAFVASAAAKPLGGSPDTGLVLDLAGQVVRQNTDGTQRLLVGGAGVSLTSNGAQVARLFCDPSSSVCSIEVTDFETPTPTSVTFDVPIELEGTDREQLASEATFSSDGRYLALIGRIGGLRAVVFDLETKEVRFSPDALGTAGGSGTLTWAKESNVLIYALDSEVNSWDMADVDTGRPSALGFKRRMLVLAS